MNTIALIAYFLEEKGEEYGQYLEVCRKKRNLVEYDSVGGATEEDVAELQEFVEEFRVY